MKKEQIIEKLVWIKGNAYHKPNAVEAFDCFIHGINKLIRDLKKDKTDNNVEIMSKIALNFGEELEVLYTSESSQRKTKAIPTSISRTRQGELKIDLVRDNSYHFSIPLNDIEEVDICRS